MVKILIKQIVLTISLQTISANAGRVRSDRVRAPAAHTRQRGTHILRHRPVQLRVRTVHLIL